jgi:hypothetical protein
LVRRGIIGNCFLRIDAGPAKPEQPSAAARWCLQQGGISAAQVDLIGFSYDPGLVRPASQLGLDDPWMSCAPGTPRWQRRSHPAAARS